jgi:hypothetical protein
VGFVAMKAATVAVLTTEHPMDDHDDFEPHHESSPTDHVLNELQLHGYRPFADEPDQRLLPDGNAVAGAVADIFDALIVTLEDTRLEPDLDDLLWSTVNVFHRATERIARELDDNEQAQKRSSGTGRQRGEVGRTRAPDRRGQTLIERQAAFELMRDQAAEHYERHVGKPWLPRSGSKVNHRNLTSAMIDSRDFLMAKKRADQRSCCLPARRSSSPAGSTSTITGSSGPSSTRCLRSTPTWCWSRQVAEGREKIASLWAKNRNVPQIGFAPDWTKHGRAAPFKRNDEMLEIVPKGVMHFPGTGINDNLADKAKKLGIPVWKFGGA